MKEINKMTTIEENVDKNSQMTFKFTKIREVKSPTRAHATDAGIDFFVPTNLTLDVMQEKINVTNCPLTMVVDKNKKIVSFTLKPNESILIPSGIKVKVPNVYMLQFNNKSGVAAKKGLLVGSSIVDVGYEGEVHLNLHNASNKEQTICADDKIVQGILVPVNFAMPEEVADENILYAGQTSERAEGGFGSSGN